jgi:hypothetical protein
LGEWKELKEKVKMKNEKMPFLLKINNFYATIIQQEGKKCVMKL